MSALILDPGLVEQMIEQRRAWGADKHDEMWDGVYVMTPLPNNEHQQLAMMLAHALYETVAKEKLGEVFPGVNISDREDDWTKNYRCPDVVVFLNDTQAKDCDTHWVGSPDFLIEVTSPYDQTREKIPFYEKIATRELLLIDRDPWQLELYQLKDGKLTLTATSTLAQPAVLTSAVLPLTFRLAPGQQRPTIEVANPATNQQWTV